MMFDGYWGDDERRSRPPAPQLTEQQKLTQFVVSLLAGNPEEGRRHLSRLCQPFAQIIGIVDALAQTQDADGAGATVGGAASSGAAVAADVNKLLRELISLVLVTRRKWQENHSASESAKRHAEELEAAVAETPLPLTENEQPLRDFLAAVQSRRQQYQQAQEAAQQAAVLEQTALTFHRQAACRLHVVVQVVLAQLKELSENDVVVAAQHMAAQALAPFNADSVVYDELLSDQPAAASGAEPVAAEPLTQVELNDLSNLELNLMRCAYQAASAQLKAPATLAAIGAIGESMWPSDDIQQPVRPTEEEVQRYLRQLEQFMTERQKAHRQGVLALNYCSETKATLQRLVSELSSAITRAQSLEGRSTAAGNLAAVGRVLYDALNEALKKLNEAPGYNATELDRLELPTPSRRDQRGIQDLRKLMREVAYAMGRLNEAESAAKALSRQGVAEADLTPLGSFTTWKQCLDWSSANACKIEEARKSNLSRATKVELLHESVQAYEAQVADGMRDLYRLVVTTTPAASAQAPCDELRALLNAAAWQVRLGKNEDHDREGDYPLY